LLDVYYNTHYLSKQMYKKTMTLVEGNKTIALFGIFVFILIVALTSLDYDSTYDINAFATTLNNTQTQPNIDAKSIYDTRTAVLGNNVKNLIILIPDEAHHGNGEAKENRFIEQSFLPQTAIINKGTQVIWFSGDVSHEHSIILNDDQSLFDSGTLPEFAASNQMVFNTVGDFGYMSPYIDQEAVQKGFVMKGDIKVVDQTNVLNSNANYTVIGSSTSAPITPSNEETQTQATNTPSTTSTTASDANIETVGVFMVPTKDIDKYVQDFKSNGFSVDSTYSFKDLRGLARDTGSEQTLLVWTAGPSMTVDTAISALKDIGEKLPYK
jgi:plastocyanin